MIKIEQIDEIKKTFDLTREGAIIINKTKIEDIYSYYIKYGGGHISVYKYIDEEGTFFDIDNPLSIIAKAIFESMEPSEKLQLFSYLEDFG